MLQKNCRIENFNGLRFYEQDILFDDYEFAGNMQITLRAKYFNPGIGIALINSEGLSIRDKNELYLFRIGATETSVLYKKDDSLKRILRNTVSTKLPNENMEIVLKKIDKRVYMYVNGDMMYNMLLPTRMDTCNIGIYSSAGNIITGMSIASNIPDGWAVNMSNTNGGYIKFIKGGFSIEQCENDAQIEQEYISLAAGTYYLNYISEDNSDIKCSAYLSSDIRPFDEDKNILKKDNSFNLAYDTKINLKFSGTTGTIRNIHISDSPLDKYVETRDGNVSIDGSYITVYTKDEFGQSIRKVEWTATIYDTPDELSQDPNDVFYVAADEASIYTPSMVNVIKNLEFRYVFDVSSSTLNVYKVNELMSSIQLSHVINKITIMKNMDTSITDFTVTDMNNNSTKLTVQRGLKKYIENNISGPIIAASEDQGIVTPLDISSSYRVFFNGSYDEFIFTNVEREIFEVANRIKLENKIAETLDAVKVYGIRHKANCKLEGIFRLENKELDNIAAMTKDYVILDRSYISEIRTLSGEIMFNGIAESNEFELIVVDYLKKDAYCINEKFDEKSYEVEVSSVKDNVKLRYDSFETSSDKDLEILTNHRLTDIAPQDNCYIVLRKEA